MVNYSNSIIYKLCCNDPNITDIYIGSTTNKKTRKHCHKNVCNNENSKDYNIYVYQFIRQNGGFDNWDMIEIERYSAIDKSDLHKKERYWIEELKSTLNKLIPARTRQEYLQDNKIRIAIRSKTYNQDNREHQLEQNKQNYQNNREKRIEQVKQYYQNNREKRIEHAQQPIECECGAMFRKDALQKHKKSAKHKLYIELSNYLSL